MATCDLGVKRMCKYKSVAWLLILHLVLQPFILVGTALYAEEGDAAPVRRTLNRRSTNPEQATQQPQTQGAQESTENSQASASDSNPTPSLQTGGRQRILTSMSQNRGSTPATASATEVSSTLALQDTAYRESLDILSPDDTSPVLAESVFGAKGKVRINLVADNVEIKSIMDYLATEYRINIVSKEIATNNRIKTSLYDIPLETVFQVLLEQSNLSYEKRNGIIYLQDRGRGQDYFLEERFFKLKQFADFDFAGKLIDNISTSRGKKILPNPEKKAYFVVEYKANLERIQKTLGDLGYLDIIDPDSSVYSHHYLAYNYVDPKVVDEIIKKHQTKDGKAIPDAKSNRYIVFDTNAAFELMKQALDFIDVPPGQVFVDVKFLDLNDDDTKRIGMSQVVDWNGNANDQDKFQFSLAADVTRALNWQISPVVNLGMSGNHDLLNTKIINNPKVMVMNNDTANIQVTENFPYVTNENSNGVISSQINQVPIGVQLNVTPKINANGEVTMTLEPKITVLKDVKIITTKVIDTNQAGGRTTETDSEFPIIDERSIKTNVTIPNGKTLIIGGLIKESDRKGVDQIPGLTKLPLLGRFFRRTTDAESKSQLYIFITPTIVKQAPATTAFRSQQVAALPSLSTSVSDSSTQTKVAVPGLQVSSAEPVSRASGSVTPMKEKVDFSTFLQKVNALREKDRQEKYAAADVQARSAEKQEGFDNLIEKLKQDIRTESEKPVAVATKSVVSTAPGQKLSAPLIPRDAVLGERAERIAKLLRAWEENPIDGVMKPKETVADPIDLRPRPPEAKALPDSSVPLSVDVGGGPRRVTVAAPEVKKIEVVVPVETKTEEVKALVEDPIQMDYFSPLGITPESRQKRPVKDPVFGFGDINGTRPDPNAVSKPVPVPEPVSSPPSEVQSASEEGTSGDDSEANTETPVRRRKVGFFEEPMSPNQFLPAPKAVAPAQKVANTGSNRSFEFTMSPQATNREPVQGSGNWVDDFLERDLTRIVVSQLSESDDEIFAMAKQETVVPQPKVPVEVPVVTPAKVQNQAIVSSSPVVIEKPKRAIVMSSPDPKTQKIFNDLNNNQNLTTARAMAMDMPATSNVEQPLEARPVSVAREPRAVPAESEFEAFLADMFSPSEASKTVSQASSVAQTAVSTSVKHPSLTASAERDFLQFLGGF